MHLDAALVAIGDIVTEGQEIGSVGKTGNGEKDKWGAHLHYEIRKNVDGVFQPIDPESSRGDIIDAQELIGAKSDPKPAKKTFLQSLQSIKKNIAELRQTFKEIKNAINQTNQKTNETTND
jgi:septal ring factor EnvC (AmiA/AmiB activator)